MDIQKEREDFEKLWTDGNGHFKFFKFDQDDCKYRLNGVTDNLPKEDLLSASITLNTAWLFWLGAKKRAVPEGFCLVEKAKLMQIVGSAAIIEPITRGNPLMSKYKTELDFILSTVRAMIEAQEQKG